MLGAMPVVFLTYAVPWPGCMFTCCCPAGQVLAGAGVDYDASLFNLLGADYVARLMHKTGEQAADSALVMALQSETLAWNSPHCFSVCSS